MHLKGKVFHYDFFKYWPQFNSQAVCSLCSVFLCLYKLLLQKPVEAPIQFNITK